MIPFRQTHKNNWNKKMIAILFTITFQILAIIQRIQDNIIPERRQRMKRQRLRNDFYSGALLKKTRGGRGVVNLSLSSYTTTTSYDCMASENNDDSDNMPVSRADTISTMLFCIAAASWVVGSLWAADFLTRAASHYGRACGWLVSGHLSHRVCWISVGSNATVLGVHQFGLFGL